MNEILYQRYVCDPKNNEDDVVAWDELPFHEYPKLETLFGENPVEKKQPNPRMLLKLKEKCPGYWKSLFENDNQLDSFIAYIANNPDEYSVMLLQTLFESVDKGSDELTLLVKKLDEVYIGSIGLPVAFGGEFFEELLNSRKWIYKNCFEKSELETAFQKVITKEWLVFDFYISRFDIDVDATTYNEYKSWIFGFLKMLDTSSFWDEIIRFSIGEGISLHLETWMKEFSALNEKKINVLGTKAFYEFLFLNYIAMENNHKDILEAVQVQKTAYEDDIKIKGLCAEYIKEMADDEEILEMLRVGRCNDVFDIEALDEAIDILLEKGQLDKVPGIILIKFGR